MKQEYKTHKRKYKVARVETRAYIIDIEAESEEEAIQNVKDGYGERKPEEDCTIEVSYQIT
ncbi:MAG: DpnD/PcfM family protein [Candidatus Neomarinimicrobiota bacterium]|jgi:hypothetical protein